MADSKEQLGDQKSAEELSNNDTFAETKTDAKIDPKLRPVPKAEDVELTIHTRKKNHCPKVNERLSPRTYASISGEKKDNILRSLLDPNSDLDFQMLPNLPDVELAKLLDMVQPEDLPTIMKKFRQVTGVRLVNLKRDMTFRNISYRKGEITYLSGVSGYVKANTMTCVIGAPDSGVTTLLRVLAGRASREAIVSGEILLGGQHVDESYGQHVGFIPKDDLHYPTLTVRETLRMSVRMRYGYLDDIYKKWFVEIVLKFLGLSGNIANTIIGDDTHRGISGGQKRRVSIATEIVAGHNVILADLLTNGLDSKTAYDLGFQMQTVARNSEEGKSFMISLVQPSPELFNLFDNLLVMSKGRCVYFGPLKHNDGYPVLEFLGSLGFAYPVGKSLPDYLAEVSANPVKFHKSRIPRWAFKQKMFTLLEGKKRQEEESDDFKSALICKHARTIQDLKAALERTAMSKGGLHSIDELKESNGGKELKVPEKDVAFKPHHVRGLSLPNNPRSVTTESGRVVEAHSIEDNEKEVGYMYLIRSYKESIPYKKLGQELWLEFDEKMPWEKTKTIPRFTTSWTYQFFQCLKREWIVKMRAKSAVIGKICQLALISIIIGTVFLGISNNQQDANARVGLLFIVLLQNTMGATEDVPDIMQKKRVYYAQEEAGYYRGSAFFLSQQVIKLPFNLINTFIFVIILYPLVGLNGGTGSEEFWYLWGLLNLVQLCAQAWVLFICSLASNAISAQASTPVGLVIFMIMCGFLISTEDIPDYWSWLSTISFLTYGFRGIMLNEFNDLSLKCDSDEFVPPSGIPNFSTAPPNGFNSQQTCPFLTGEAFLATYDMDGFEPDHEKSQVLYYLLAFIAVFNAFAFIGLVVWPHELGDQVEPPRFEKSLEVKWKGKEMSRDSNSDEKEEEGKGELKVKEEDANNTHHKAIKEHGEKIISYFEWKDLTYEVVNQKKKGERITLLNKVAGYAAPGDMVALMGPSGAGKSTLLDVIAGKKRTGFITGEILVNGKEVDDNFPRMAGYVEQFDSHVELATVEESVYFSAKLRLETDDEEEIKREVDHAMESVGVMHVKDELIGNLETGGISPELRKKTAIAVELVMRPTILFLDEPTTGLDSVSAMAVIDTVTDLADRGLAVVCTIHQPSAELFSRFSRILILEPFRTGAIRGGRVSYFGDVEALPGYCKQHNLGELVEGRNVADFALEALGGPCKQADGSTIHPAEVFLKTKEWEETKALLDQGVFASANKQTGGDLKVPKFKSVFAKGPWEQFRTVMERTMKTTFRDKDTIGGQFGSNIVMGFIFGTLFFQLPTDQSGATNRVSLFFLCMVFIAFTSAYKINILQGARASFFRETTSNMYRGWVFYLTQLIADTAVFLPRAVIYSCMIYFLTGLSLDNNGAHFWLYFLGMCCLYLLGLTLAELWAFATPNIELGQGLFTLSITIQSLFAGFLVREDDIPPYWIWLYYINPLRYLLSYFCVNELQGLDITCPGNEGAVPIRVQDSFTDSSGATIICDSSQLDNLNCFRYFCPITSGDDVLEQFNMTDSLGFYIGITILFIGALRVINIFIFTFVNWVEK